MTRLSYKEAKALGLISESKSKYNNAKPEYYDPDLKETLKFDSNKEFEYYLLLKDRLKRGEIYELKRQVKLLIQPAFIAPNGEKIKEISYIADFVYTTIDRGQGVVKQHYIDVKGFKTDVYRLKKKLLAYRGFYIEEV